MPSLIPFALENESILKLATYLLRHTTGSHATLYQYVFGVHRYCKWARKSPDEVVRESLLDRKALEQYVASLDDFARARYHDYDTFLGAEAVEYLRAYLGAREKGTRNDKWGTPPEELNDDSPLIRNSQTKRVKPVTPGSIHLAIHKLFVKASIIQKGTRKRYDVRAHSLRKYFRTQLGSLSTIPTDYIEYMMGHTISTYNDVKMKGIDFLRNLYASSGLSIRPKTKLSKVEQLKLMIEAWGMDPNKILSREALSMSHTTLVDTEPGQIECLNQALKQAIIKELQTAQTGI